MANQILDISVGDQEEAIKVIRLFQRKSKCGYGIQIEDLMRSIMTAETNDNIQNHLIKLKSLITAFMRHNFLKPKKGKPEAWDSFFNLFSIPLKLTTFQLKELTYWNGMFDGVSKIEFEYWLDDSIPDNIELGIMLEKWGYEAIGRAIREIPLQDSENNQGTKLKRTGKIYKRNVELHYLFSTEEQMFFLFKYVLFYEMFSFWKDICSYKMTVKNKSGHLPHIWYLRDRKIPNIIEPVIDALLIRLDNKPNSIIYDFAYESRDLSPTPLNILFNQFLFSKLKEIEKKMMIYVLNRYKSIKS